jgi:YVTN family beta-propeller protein
MLAVVSNTGSGDVSIVDVAARKAVRTVKVGKAPKRLTVGLVEVAP